MAKFTSETVSIQADADTVFNFMSDFRNFEALMPDQISNWKADATTCSFTIEGVSSLSMRIASTSPNTNVHIVSVDKKPVDFTLDCFIHPGESGQSSATIEFDAALNVFMKSVASRPLQSFVNKLAEKLQQQFG